jgi:hypothetical protein
MSPALFGIAADRAIVAKLRSAIAEPPKIVERHHHRNSAASRQWDEVHPETGHIVKVDQVGLLRIQYRPEVLRDTVVPEVVVGFERSQAGSPNDHSVVIFPIETSSGVRAFGDSARKYDHVMTACRYTERLASSHDLGAAQHVWRK